MYWIAGVVQSAKLEGLLNLYVYLFFFFPFSLHSQDLQMGSIIPQQDTAATVSNQCHPDLFHFNTEEGWHGKVCICQGENQKSTEIHA